MSEPKVVTQRIDRVWVVSINRPEVRNCVDGETAGQLNEAVRAFTADAGLDSMILTGAGTQAFCSGADLKNIGSLGSLPGARESGPMGISRMTNVTKPTIAAINGYSTAGGLELACWCDFRIADATAQLGVLNRRWGVPLVDGGTQRLPRIVGLGNALYLIETGALLNARQAFAMGLVQEVVPAGKALERAIAIATTMSTYPQGAIRNDRAAALGGLALSLEDGLKYEAEVHRDTANDPVMAQWLQRFAAGERPTPIEPPS